MNSQSNSFEKNSKVKRQVERPLTDGERIEKDKTDNLIAWITYFRQNPARFAVEYLGIKMLAPFQKFILHMMFISINVVWIASRGIGKTFLCWLYAIVRCILYPGTQIVFTSTSQGQATKLMNQKMQEFMAKYPNIKSEIEKVDTGRTPMVKFFNGSIVWIAPPSDGALGFRANCIIIDEYRKVDDSVIQTVFRKFLTAPRQPLFLSLRDENDELVYKDYPIESNIEIYISSQAPTYELAYTRYYNAIKNMTKFDKYLAICLPYYLGVKEGIISKETILKELQEEGADMSVFALEYECIPYGSSENSYFTSQMFSTNRKIDRIFVPMTSKDYLMYKEDLNKNPFYIPKVDGEKRMLCVDTASTGSANSANTIVHCVRLIPTEVKKERSVNGTKEKYVEKYYQKQVVYIKNITGDLNHSTQAKIIKRIFYLFEANTLVIDAQGNSLGVIYQLVLPTYDDEYNLYYKAYDSFNDEVVSSYCKEPEEERLKVIYSVKVSGGSAYDMQHRYNTYTRMELISRHITLPVIESIGEEYLRTKFKYDEQNPETQAEWISVFRQTDALIAEAVNLEKVLKDGGTKVILEIPKKSTIRRRDRIIALQYGMLYAQELEIEDFKFVHTANLMNYNFGKGVQKKTVSPFGNNFNKINGFGWKKR